MSKGLSAFGYGWRGFRLLRHRRRLSVIGASRRAGVRRNEIIYSETRHGNIDFLTASRLLGAYEASILDLGLMTKLAAEHLGPEKGLYKAKILEILAEFERLTKHVSPGEVPMPNPLALLAEIDGRIAPLEDFVCQASVQLEAFRIIMPGLAQQFGVEWTISKPETENPPRLVELSRLPFQWSRPGVKRGGR